MGAGGILSKETGAGAGLVVGGVLSKEFDDGVGTGAGLVWVFDVAVRVDEGQGCETVTREEGVCFKSIGLGVSIDLEGATDSKFVVILEGISNAEEEVLVVTEQAGDTVTGA